MKKVLTWMMSLVLLCSFVTASANGWGLTGGIYDIVSDDKAYDSYTAIADDGNERVGTGAFSRHLNHAILSSRYHNVLIAAQRVDKVWEAEIVSTTAVYQPGDERGLQPVLTHESDGFNLVYLNPKTGDPAEEYFFLPLEGDYQLFTVRYIAEDGEISNSYMVENGGLLFFQSGVENSFQPIGDAMWFVDGVTLAEFNIEQTPRSMMEVRQANMTRSVLDAAAEPLAVQAMWEGVKEGRKLPVYSAPDAASYRSAEGKASVSMGGEVEILGTAEGWTLIQYAVSQRTSRIGWIEGEFAPDVPLTLGNVPLVTAADTFLTDDPFVSQFAQTYLPAGTEITGLARCGEYYAYAEYTQGSTLYRGFVPLKDLMPKYDRALTTGEDLLAADVRWDVMDMLVGKWDVAAGGSLMGERCIFFADGSWSNHLPGFDAPDKVVGNFRVYGGEEGYSLVMYTEDNIVTRFTLTLLEDGSITLSGEDGEGTYTRNEYSTYGNG